MTSGKLMYALEKKGFSLEFPLYDSNEDLILNILRERDQRIDAALPLCLQEPFEYKEIKNKLDPDLIKKMNKIILIAKEIFLLENIPHEHLDKIIWKEHIKGLDKQEFIYFYDAFQHSRKTQEKQKDRDLTREMDLRMKLDTNKALQILFSPAKKRILEKICNYQELTMTELKYYYKSIRPINRAILHPVVQKYLRIIETTRKIR